MKISKNLTLLVGIVTLVSAIYGLYLWQSPSKSVDIPKYGRLIKLSTVDYADISYNIEHTRIYLKKGPKELSTCTAITGSRDSLKCANTITKTYDYYFNGVNYQVSGAIYDIWLSGINRKIGEIHYPGAGNNGGPYTILIRWYGKDANPYVDYERLEYKTHMYNKQDIWMMPAGYYSQRYVSWTDSSGGLNNLNLDNMMVTSLSRTCGYGGNVGWMCWPTDNMGMGIVGINLPDYDEDNTPDVIDIGPKDPRITTPTEAVDAFVQLYEETVVLQEQYDILKVEVDTYEEKIAAQDDIIATNAVTIGVQIDKIQNLTAILQARQAQLDLIASRMSDAIDDLVIILDEISRLQEENFNLTEDVLVNIDQLEANNNLLTIEIDKFENQITTLKASINSADWTDQELLYAEVMNTITTMESSVVQMKILQLQNEKYIVEIKRLMETKYTLERELEKKDFRITELTDELLRLKTEQELTIEEIGKTIGVLEETVKMLGIKLEEEEIELEKEKVITMQLDKYKHDYELLKMRYTDYITTHPMSIGKLVVLLILFGVGAFLFYKGLKKKKGG